MIKFYSAALREGNNLFDTYEDCQEAIFETFMDGDEAHIERVIVVDGEILDAPKEVA